LHLLPIGVLQDVIAPLLWEWLEDSSLHRFCGLEPSASWDDALVSFTAKARAWARARKLDLCIKPLTMKKLNLTFALDRWPELEGRVKAGRRKVLMHFVAHAAVAIEQELPDNATGHAVFMARQRTTMAWSVSTLLQLWAAGSKPYLSDNEVRESTFLGDLFLATFQRLAAYNVHANKLLYHFKPKIHMLGHLFEFAAQTKENPESFSNWVDEDNMKWLAKIAASLKPKTAGQQL
ncbi:unnamed protein product, partial [Symbiodinium sp. CCMP2456]